MRKVLCSVLTKQLLDLCKIFVFNHLAGFKLCV